MKGTPKSLKISALITTLGIALAVAVLVVSLSVASGFEESYKRSILDFNAHLVLLKDNGEIRNYENLIDQLKTFEGIAAETPFIYRETMFISKGVVKGAVIKGVDFARFPTVSSILLKEFGLNTQTLKHLNTVFLGKSLASKLNITGPTTINILLGANKFEKVDVIGTFESGLYDYDSQFALMSLQDVQKLFGMGDEITGIEMKITDPDNAPLMQKILEDEFSYPYNVTTWQELNKPIFEAVHLEKKMFTIIVGTLVLVGMFNIIGTLVLRIIYKVKDISILSAIGMKSFLIRGVFTFHGTMLGVVGTFAGLVFGIILAYIIGHLKLVHIEPEIYFLSSLPVTIDFNIVLIIAAAGAFISWLVSFIASTRIAALNVVEGLK